ncbi:hypothetical protein E2C01_088086 [Portunus trituberculatus]|uniref:Uncharacterized protein n=1 Tax=Portunus trituberculatus TaxID=210409 RepID=A0A5B7J569_PORTR|nr:hypothetical protein [Portunus trituberculatus]
MIIPSDDGTLTQGKRTLYTAPPPTPPLPRLPLYLLLPPRLTGPATFSPLPPTRQSSVLTRLRCRAGGSELMEENVSRQCSVRPSEHRWEGKQGNK